MVQLNEIHNPETEHASVSLKVILLVFAVILVGVLSYLVWDYNTTPDTAGYATTTAIPKTTTKTTESETVDWETYTGKYFSFMYPKDWTIDSSNVSQDAEITVTSPETQKLIDETISSEGPGADIAFRYYISVAEEPENKANNYGATTLDELATESPTYKKIGDITINGITGVEGIRAGLSAYYQVFLVKSSHLYEMFFTNTLAKSDLSSTEKLIRDSLKVL